MIEIFIGLVMLMLLSLMGLVMWNMRDYEERVAKIRRETFLNLVNTVFESNVFIKKVGNDLVKK